MKSPGLTNENLAKPESLVHAETKGKYYWVIMLPCTKLLQKAKRNKKKGYTNLLINRNEQIEDEYYP